MFSRPKIFSRFPKLVSYVGTRDLFMRPRQFHEESINLQENVGKLEQDFGVKKAFFLAQCQSSEVIEITEDNLSDTLYADACFTRLNDISLNVVVADCVPILLYDRVQNVVGVIHAGWRGSAGKILEKTLSFLQETHTSKMEDVIIFIGPSISQEYYEIGSEVAELFSESIIQSDGKYFLDIKGENLRQALAYGVLRENIELSHECTYKLSEKYFSYRRERIKANFVCGIGLKTH